MVLVQKLKGGGLGLVLNWGLVLVLDFTSCSSGGTMTSFEIYLGLYLHKMFHQTCINAFTHAYTYMMMMMYTHTRRGLSNKGYTCSK